MKACVLSVIFSCILVGCGEHQLCEKRASLAARVAIDLKKAINEGGTLGDLNSANVNTKELIKVDEEIAERKISCKS
jgi:hypothetical protein